MDDNNTFVWQQLLTSDQETSGAFFSRLFSWSLDRVEGGEAGPYTLFKRAGQSVAGMSTARSAAAVQGSHWQNYIGVDNVDLSARRAVILGGRILVEPHDLPDVGRVCAVSDPTGAVVHLLQGLSVQ
jgi:predicted enzyme related to lactoylglutathione lyase